MKRTKRISNQLGWLLGIAMVLFCTVAVTQVVRNNRHNQPSPEMPGTVAQNEDSVEVIGTPVNDDPWSAINNLVNSYHHKTGVSYKGMIKVIDDNGDQEKIIEEQPFEYTLVDQYYRYKLDHIEMISKKGFLLMIDHDNKLMTISSNKGIPRQNRLFDLDAFRKVMQERNAHARVTQSGQEKILTIDNIDDPDIQGYRIYYAPQTYTIHKILIGMARLTPLEEDKAAQPGTTTEADAGETTIHEYQYYLEANFSEVKTLTLKVKDFHPENKFIRLYNGNVAPAPEFKDYQLINNLEP